MGPGIDQPSRLCSSFGNCHHTAIERAFPAIVLTQTSSIIRSRPVKWCKPGYIVNITTLGARPNRSNATPIYVAAKFGLAGFTDAVRRLGIRDGILVTEILPGSVASEFDIDDPIEAIVEKYGQSRVHPRDIAEAVVFSLSRSRAGMVEELGIPSIGDWFEDFSRYQ